MQALSLRLISGLVLGMCLTLPLLAHAQSADLNATIRAALAADPRTATMSQAQIEAMVSVLAQRAQQVGLTPGDITWRPLPAGNQAANLCGGYPAYLCTINSAFGFDGTDYTIPMWLATSSLLLILLSAVANEHRRSTMMTQRITQPVL